MPASEAGRPLAPLARVFKRQLVPSQQRRGPSTPARSQLSSAPPSFLAAAPQRPPSSAALLPRSNETSLTSQQSSMEAKLTNGVVDDKVRAGVAAPAAVAGGPRRKGGGEVTRLGSMDDISKVVIPDSEAEEDDVCVCKRCGEVHGVKDIEECCRVCREQSRCTRCGLVHRDYDISVLIIDGFDTFDCELYIPNVDELQMEDGTIILLDHVQQRVDELRLQKTRKEQDAKTDT